MPNGIKGQSRQVALWNDRPVVVLMEDEHGEQYYHGVMIGPAGMSVRAALKKLDAAYRRAVRKAGDEWNYDDVLAEMKAAGFEEVLAAEWWEHRAL